MLKKIMNITNAKELNRNQLLSIQGGRKKCMNDNTGQCEDRGDHCSELACSFDLDC